MTTETTASADALPTIQTRRMRLETLATYAEREYREDLMNGGLRQWLGEVANELRTAANASDGSPMREMLIAAEHERQRPKDDVSAPRDTDCEAIRDERIGVLARAEDGSAAMTMVLRDPDAPRDFDPGTVIATLTLDDGRTASDRVTASWAAQVLRELGGARR